jgi:hypothetical protein
MAAPATSSRRREMGAVRSRNMRKGEPDEDARSSPLWGCRPVHDGLFRQGKHPLVVEEKLEAAEKKLRGDDIEIERKTADAEREMKVERISGRSAWPKRAATCSTAARM